MRRHPAAPLPTADPVPDETKRRGQLILRTLPILLVPISVTLFVGLALSQVLPFGSLLWIGGPAGAVRAGPGPGPGSMSGTVMVPVAPPADGQPPADSGGWPPDPAPGSVSGTVVSSTVISGTAMSSAVMSSTVVSGAAMPGTVTVSVALPADGHPPAGGPPPLPGPLPPAGQPPLAGGPPPPPGASFGVGFSQPPPGVTVGPPPAVTVGSGVVLRAVSPQLSLEALAPIAMVLALCALLVVFVRLRRVTLAAFTLVVAWTAITTLTAPRSGVMGFWPSFFLLPICASALLLGRMATIAVTVVTTALVGGLAWLEFNGIALFPRPPEFPRDIINMPALTIAHWTGLFWTVAALVYLLAGSLQDALKRSRAQADALSRLSGELEARVQDQTAELARRAERAEALYAVSRALTAMRELPPVLALIGGQASRLLGYDAALMLLSEEDDSGFAVVGEYRAPDSLASVLRQQAERLHAVHREHRPAALRLTSPDGTGSLSALALPMMYGDSVAGVLVLVETGAGREPSADDLALAEGFASQAALAIANAELLTEAREAATMEERTRLARDIHDTLAQGLAGVVVQLGATERALAAAPGEAHSHLDLALAMARESLAEARRSVWNLRSPALERGDLGDALRNLVAQPLPGGTTVTFHQLGEAGDPLTAALPPAVESALLRVGQEALVNVAKHARAARAEVTLEYAPAEVRLIVRDDGVGFDPRAVEQKTQATGPWSGFGVLGMRERIAALGGTLELANAGGAVVVAAVPRSLAVSHQPSAISGPSSAISLRPSAGNGHAALAAASPATDHGRLPAPLLTAGS